MVDGIVLVVEGRESNGDQISKLKNNKINQFVVFFFKMRRTNEKFVTKMMMVDEAISFKVDKIFSVVRSNQVRERHNNNNGTR